MRRAFPLPSKAPLLPSTGLLPLLPLLPLPQSGCALLFAWLGQAYLPAELQASNPWRRCSPAQLQGCKGHPSHCCLPVSSFLLLSIGVFCVATLWFAYLFSPGGTFGLFSSFGLFWLSLLGSYFMQALYPGLTGSLLSGARVCTLCLPADTLRVF